MSDYAVVNPATGETVKEYPTITDAGLETAIAVVSAEIGPDGEPQRQRRQRRRCHRQDRLAGQRTARPQFAEACQQGGFQSFRRFDIAVTLRSFGPHYIRGGSGCAVSNRVNRAVHADIRVSAGKSSTMRCRSASLARFSRERTVPTGQPMMAAASA